MDGEGIQRQPSAPKPAANEPTPSEPPRCPHCDHALARKDVELGTCWYCYKRLANPVQPDRPTPRPPFLATFLFGVAGAIAGTIVGYIIEGQVARGSWAVSICGGIGFGLGSALARSLFTPTE